MYILIKHEIMFFSIIFSYELEHLSLTKYFIFIFALHRIMNFEQSRILNKNIVNIKFYAFFNLDNKELVI